MVTFDEFKKLEIIIARIENVRDHPDADKLLILEVSTGVEKKEIVAGIKKFYAKEKLVGKDIVMVNNLEPVTIRGVKSNGMLLAAEDESGICLIIPDRSVKSGSKIK